MFLVQLFFFVQNLLNTLLVLFTDLFSPLVTIPMAPMIIGMTKHFICHIRRIYVRMFLYFILFYPTVLLGLLISKFHFPCL